MRRFSLALAAVATFTIAPATQAQTAATAATLDAKARAEVIDALARELQRGYVFADKAVTMEQHLRAQLSKGVYDALREHTDFARTLTDDLQSITRDKHLRVRVGGPPTGPRPTGVFANRPSPFGEPRRLDGNVAYIEIRSFGFPPDDVRDEVRSIMSAAADAPALILDLRGNGGGHPGMVALVSSYLFGDEPVLLNSLYWRAQNRTDNFYTDPKVEGKKFGPTKPVYVLTSRFTFSAAEEFTYNLQTRKRAIIVGETTGGGAHPGGMVSLPHGLMAFVPHGRAINPITKTNWEGTGVIPDVTVPSDDAYGTALKLALERIGQRKR